MRSWPLIALALAVLGADGGPADAGGLFQQINKAASAPKAVHRDLPTGKAITRSVRRRGFRHPRLQGGRLATEPVSEASPLLGQKVWKREGGYAVVLRYEQSEATSAVRTFAQIEDNPLTTIVKDSVASMPERYRRLIPRLARARAAGLDELVEIEYLADAVAVDPAERPTVQEYREGNADGVINNPRNDASIAAQLAALRKTHPGLEEDDVVLSRDGLAIKLEPMPRFDAIRTGFARGVPLTRFVGDLIKAGDDRTTRAEVLKVASELRALMKKLRKHQLAHGDLQHGNLFVRQDGRGRPRFDLIDPDGVWSPEVAELGTANGGHEDYQHPGRGEQFDAELDNFSSALIYLSLLAIADQPELYPDRKAVPSLLISAEDLANPDDPGRMLAALRQRPGEVGQLARRLTHYLGRPARETPPLERFIQEATSTP